MCGIAGIIQSDKLPVSPVVLKRMGDSLKHRGPDGEGYYVNGSAGLAHRRLAIIDLSPAGHQPMLSKDGRYVLTYNGEIYNFQELRLELETAGYSFRSRSDSEVVLNSFVHWGIDCVRRFNGMFAFGIWDNVKSNLILARDRYGIKPLYTWSDGNVFCFASEIKAFFEHPSFRKNLDFEGLAEYLTFQNFITDRTLLKNVRTFPAGHWGLFSQEKQIEMHQFWDFNFQESSEKMSQEDCREEVSRLFHQAVNRQLVSDVELGVYLSSGMDSGSITAIAAQQIPYLKSFTVGFDLNSASGMELAFDERENAEYMSYLFKTEHYEMVLKAGDMERVLPTLAWHLEEPRVGQSYPNFYAAKLASKFCKVVLAGSGGDEIFAGYPWRYYRAVLNTDFEDYISKYFDFWQRLIPKDRAENVFRPIHSELKRFNARDLFKSVFSSQPNNPSTPEEFVNNSLYFEAKTFLHGILTVEDKLNMAHSLESRVPFLDNDLVDFATRIPVKFKLGHLKEVVRINENEPAKQAKYYEKTRDGKLILRKALDHYVPNKIARAVKKGFSAPDSSWFKGESIDFVKRIIMDGQSPIYEVLDRDAIKALVNEHLSGQNNRRLLIWSLLNLDSIFRLWHIGTDR